LPKLFFLASCLLAFTNAAGSLLWKLHITGTKVYSERFLIEQLDLPAEMDVISPERRNFIIKLAKGNLEDFYQSNGYFSESISLTVSEEIIDSIRTEIYTFDIYEGERYRFGDASIEFIAGPDSLIAADRLAVTKGDFYNPEQISNDQKEIRNAYHKKGYIHIVTEHLEYVDTTEKKINVRYFVNPKNQVIMGNFKSRVFRSGLISGQIEPEIGLSNTDWLNKLWEIPQDSIIDGQYYFSFRTKLFSTQLFSQVQLEDTLQENGLSDITLTAYERVPGEAKYGFFFEEIYGFGISLSSLHRNLFGSFHELGVGATLAENRQELSLNYAHPLLFGTGISWIPTAIRLEEKIIFNHETLPSPVKPDSLVERWEVVNRANLLFGLSDHIRSRNMVDFRFLRLQGEDYYKIKIETGLIFDFTDNSYDPIFGIRLVPSFGAGGELQNDFFGEHEIAKKWAEFWKISLEHVFTYIDASAFVYLPIFRNLLSAFAFSYGNIFRKAAVDDAEIFYQGGGRTLRGYRFRSVFPYKIDPKDAASLLGGTSPQYFRINEEFRIIPPWKTLQSFQLVQFTDWVRINDSDKSFNAAQEMSLGLGLRYKWQFLTIRLDYALKTTFDDFKPDKFNFSHLVFDLSQAI
jgi:outer membrane protein assembly factor BamA